jgi:hypothetical protein
MLKILLYNSSIGKMILANGITIGVLFTDIEMLMKVSVFIITMGYALWKWRADYRDDKQKRDFYKEVYNESKNKDKNIE